MLKKIVAVFLFVLIFSACEGGYNTTKPPIETKIKILELDDDEGWLKTVVVENKPGHISPNKWTRSNFTQNFNAIDPDSISSACIQWHNSYSDTWLVTASSYLISPGSSIEFYTLYDGYYLNVTQMNFLVSSEGTTWTQLWTTGNTVSSFSHRWSKNSIDLSAYEGQNLFFAWQYIGDDGYYMALDGVYLTILL